MENAEKAGNDPRTIITRVLDWIKDKINAIRMGTGIGSKDDLAALEKAQKLWQDMYDVATARQNEKMEGKEVKRFDKQGNPVDGDGKLIVEKTNSVDELSDDDFTNPSHSVELPKIPDNVDKAIGAKGKPVIIKKNIFEKNARDHADLTPEQSCEIFNAALYRPDLYGQNQMATRPYNYVVISTKEADGKNKLVLLEVNNGKDNVEIVHWHYIRDKALETLKRQAEREGGRILILPSDASEEAGGLSSRTHDLSSIGKDTDSSANVQGKIGESGLVSDEERAQYYREEFDPLRKAGFSGASVERLKKARAFVEEELAGARSLLADANERLSKNSDGDQFAGLASTREQKRTAENVIRMWGKYADALDGALANALKDTISYDPSVTYKTQDGRQVACKSLLDEMGVHSGDEAAMAQQQTEKAPGANSVITPSDIRLRKLKRGETCHAERVYEETKRFDFTGKEKVESAEDVAYIFRQLENAAVENSFLVLVKDGRPTVIHLGVGNYVGVMAPYEQAFVAYRKLKPEQVYFVHNHPSGNLKASRQDQELLNRIKRAFGEDVVRQGIIIDTTSGNYGEFESIETAYETYSVEEEMPQSQGGEVPVKVYQFSRQVFAPGWNPETAFKVVSSQGVAEFVSSHRLGEHKKMSFLVVNNNGNVVANVFLPWTKLSDIKRKKDAGDLLAGYVHQCGGVRGVLYGNYDYEPDDRDVLASVGLRMRQLNAPLMDVLHVEHSAYESGWAGVGEPREGYDVDAYRELVSGADLDFDPVETARRNSEMRRSEREGADARLSVREEALRDALVDKMRNAGMDVSTDWKEGQRVLDEINGRVTLSKEQKKILDTATMASEIAQANKATAVSSTSGAKVLKKLESLKEKLGKLSSNRSKTILGDISEALKSEDTAPDRREGSSYYKTFVTENGKLVTIRISNHNATVSNFDANNEKDGISIVISNHPDKGINNDGDAHIEEFFYSKAALSRAYGKPLADMVGALSDAVRYGRFKDPTGIAIPHEVNAEKVREHRAYHGSAADFDMFDHSHMGEGEGAQAYGWGSYLTEVEGIGRTYARSAAAGNNRNNVELAEAERRLDEAERVERQTLSRIRDAEERLIQLERTIEVLQTDISEYTRRRRELVAQHGEGSVQVENFDFVDGEMLEEDITRLKRLKEESLPETKADLEEFKSDLEQARQTVKVLERKLDEIEKSRPILYSVEIPDDNGSNYLYYEKPVSQDLQAKAAEGLKARGFEQTTLRNGHTAYVKGASQVVFYEGQKGADFYEELAIGFADELGSAGKRTDSEGDRMASEFLHELGVIGVKYPAEFRSGGRNDGKHNFVMFNEGDMKIVDKARFFRTRNGDAYGFTLNGKIYLDPRIATSETAVHEYSHLWAQALRKGNADEWRNVTRLMKDSPVWNEVRELYPELRSEDEIAESRERDVKEQFDRTRQRGIDTADRILDDATATDKQRHQRMTDVIREVTRIDGLRKAGKETVKERVRSIADTLTEMIPATDELTRGEVKRLIGKIDKAMDVKDVKRNVREAVNIVLKSAERDVDAETMRLRKTKGKRLDADSQLKQGQLDLKGQHVLDEFNRVADDVAVDLDQLEQQYAGEMGNMDLSEVQRANAADKLDGVKLAQLYRESVKEKDQNISELNEMKRAEEEKIYNFKKRLVFDADGNVVKNKRTGEVRTETVKMPVIQSVISNSFWGCN